MAVNTEIPGGTGANITGHHTIFINGQSQGIKTVGNCRLKFMIKDPLTRQMDVGAAYVIQYVAAG